MTFFSDGEPGPATIRDVEVVEVSVWRALVGAARKRVAGGQFASYFPVLCMDGRVFGVDEGAVMTDLFGVVPELQRFFMGLSMTPDMTRELPDAPSAMDFVEFVWRSVAEPMKRERHEFGKHDDLSDFSTHAAQRQWELEVNQLFARNGLAFELVKTGRVRRLGTPVLSDRLAEVVLASGDDVLDRLLSKARGKYFDPDPAVRLESLEPLWDAFERSKTLAVPSDKKTSVGEMIAQASSTTEFADVLAGEMRTLTDVGNEFRVRHHEVGKIEVDPSEVDFLFHRCFAAVAQLLNFHRGSA